MWAFSLCDEFSGTALNSWASETRLADHMPLCKNQQKLSLRSSSSSSRRFPWLCRDRHPENQSLQDSCRDHLAKSRGSQTSTPDSLRCLCPCWCRTICASEHFTKPLLVPLFTCSQSPTSRFSCEFSFYFFDPCKKLHAVAKITSGPTQLGV